MTESAIIRRRQGRNAFWLAVVLALILVLLYSLLYVLEPFSPFVNDVFSNLVPIAAAGVGMCAAGVTARRYESSDPPRGIWSQLAVGLLLWMMAEIVWAVYNLTMDEVGLTVADLMWVLAYLFFLRALLRQYKLLFPPESGRVLQWLVAWGGSILTLTTIFAWLLTIFTGQPWGVALVVSAFYPAADIVISLASLQIVYRFGSGALGFPWIGLFVFAVSDLLYAILEASGAYSWSVTSGNLLSAIADITYVAAYLFVGLGCYAQLLLLRHGPIFILHRNAREAS
ncbi:MAG: hypothetical protein AB1649_15490 [Chloroflexota bacterium]